MTINLTPYFLLDRNAKEAVEFYKEIFNTEVVGL